MAKSTPAAAAAAAAAVEPVDPAKVESAPRKRRRRAPTTGASVDCFACQQSQTACDRRRPYCTPCIERGKTCSGYKTTLTWGVGVASRGKLRGLSLPVAAAKANLEDGKGTKYTPAKTASLPRPRAKPAPAIVMPQRSDAALPPTVRSPPTLSPRPPMFRFGASQTAPQDQISPSSREPPQFDWSATNVQPTPAPAGSELPKKNSRRHSLQPLQMPPPVMTAMLGQTPMTAGVYGGYQFGSLDSALDSQSPSTPYTYQEPDGSTKPYPAPGPYGRFPDGYRSGYSSSSWRSDTLSSGLSSGLSSNPSSHDFGEDDPFARDLATASVVTSNSHAQPPRVSYSFPYADFSLPEGVEEFEEVGCSARSYAEGGQTLISPAATSTLHGPLVGRTVNLRELINYYDQVIAPVILAFDGPTNPYRTHILRLACSSDALQHAIAALAASNLRMRKDHQPLLFQEQKLITDTENRHDESVRKSSIAHNALRDRVERADESPQQGKHLQRELYHKGHAIQALNAELLQLQMNPFASDDTVLATLLVLCLYHICDTGVAKFRTQFAGVKKLMALRKRRAKSRDSNWLLLMFKWFDAITATVNDRESQFEEYMDDDDLDEWALENLAGCDGRLFKIISKLGRLNMLSQGKSVSDGNATPRAQPPRPSEYDALPSGMYNGVSYMPPPDENPLEMYPPFALEWYALHQSLHDWQFDPATIPQSMRSARNMNQDMAGVGQHTLDPDVIDLRHISESFRYSALLYLERIAHPWQPSAATNFCLLVNEAIYHIQAVKSDVYLLWPLFITGSECVMADHRNLIRQRCRSIQSDSGFYNNTSTLDLLEKTWQEKDRRAGGGEAAFPESGVSGPFEWRKNMNTGEEEYIVI